MTTALTKLVKDEDWKTIREFLKNRYSHLFSTLDIGGQPEFHEILPLLLHGMALNLIFFNVTHDLDSPYTVVVYRSDSTLKGPYKYDFRVHYIIQRALCITSLQLLVQLVQIFIAYSPHDRPMTAVLKIAPFSKLPRHCHEWMMYCAQSTSLLTEHRYIHPLRQCQ